MSISLRRVPAGEPGGVRLWDSREKEVVYLGSFFDPEVTKIKSGGHGSHDLRHKGPVKISLGASRLKGSEPN